MEDDDHPLLQTSKHNLKHQDVYFLQAVTLGLVKIGVTCDIKQRLRSIQGLCPDKIRVLGILHCSRRGATEGEVHKEFAHLRSHGEWFHPDPTLLHWIRANADTVSKDIVLLQRIVDFPLGTRMKPGQRKIEMRLRKNIHLGRVHLPRGDATAA